MAIPILVECIFFKTTLGEIFLFRQTDTSYRGFAFFYNMKRKIGTSEHIVTNYFCVIAVARAQ